MEEDCALLTQQSVIKLAVGSGKVRSVKQVRFHAARRTDDQIHRRLWYIHYTLM